MLRFLICSNLDNLYGVTEITVNPQGLGDWRSVLRCRGAIAVGFELRSEEPQDNHDNDNTAANNFRLRCSDERLVTGDGLYSGHWTGEQRCEDGYGLCAINAQIEFATGGGINRIEVIKMSLYKICPLFVLLWYLLILHNLKYWLYVM